MNFNLDHKIIQTDEKHYIEVRFNGNKCIGVNRQKLLESSPYFQNMLSSCFKDHKTEFVEVNYPAGYETFEKAMQFVNKGDIDLTNENIFETFLLADYLLMEELKKCCLDAFTSSLDRNNVQTKFNLLKESKFSVDEFKRRALNFIEHNTCGLYCMLSEPYEQQMLSEPIEQQRSNLNYFSEKNNTYCNISCHHHDDSVKLDLHCLNNTVVMCPTTKEKESYIADSMVMYDLITGKTKEIKVSFEGLSVSCSNEKNMFIITVVEDNSDKKLIYMETFEVSSFTEFRSTKDIIDSSLISENKIIYFHFAHCFEDKIYIFYLKDEEYRDPVNNNMMIVCRKTLRIIKNINLAYNDMFLDDAIIDDRCRKIIFQWDSLKLFHHEKENKLFIKFDERLDNFNHVLVFDIKNKCFYVKEDLVQLKEDIEHVYDIKIATKGDKFYGILQMCKRDPGFDQIPYDEKSITVWEDIRIFKFEKDTLVETGILWTSDKRRISDYEWSNFQFWNVNSHIFVRNVQLN